MKRKSLLALGLMTPGAVAFAQVQAADVATAKAATCRPNIVFFLVDDFGWVDSEVAYGEQDYPYNHRFNTPNMKRFSQQATILTNAYAAPVSTPTRTSLMTGMHAAHEHITDFTSPYRDTPMDFSAGGVGIPRIDSTDVFSRGEWNYNGLYPVNDQYFPLDSAINNTLPCTPMVQLLKDNGYFTIHIGKAHWGSAGIPSANPLNMGFVMQVAGGNNSHMRTYLSEDNFGNTSELWNPYAIQNMQAYYGTGVHLTEALTREALKALEFPIQTGQPFYLYMSHYAVHTPVSADPRYFKKYRQAGMDKKEAQFASIVEGADKSLGDVLDFLEKKGVADNTIIIFYSDNGGHSANKAKGGQPHTQNLPLREGKASVYEGGTRVPMMVYWPGKTAAKARVNTPVSCEDFFPTIMEMAGIKDYKTIQPLDGQSWVKLVTDGSQYVAKAEKDGLILDQKSANRFTIPEEVSGLNPDRLIISHMPHQWRGDDQDDIDFMSSIRRGDWKLVYRMHNAVTPDHKGAFELYNLSEDITEHADQAAQHPKLVKELAKLLSDKLRSWDATMPIVKATGKPCPWPDEILK